MYTDRAELYTGLVKLHYNAIHRFCNTRLSGNSSDADDVTQDIFILLYMNLDELSAKPDVDFSKWLYRTAANKINEQYRKLKKQRKILDIDSLSDLTEISYSDNYEYEKTKNTDFDKYAHEIVASLSPDERMMYNFIYNERLKYADIANRTGRSLAAVKVAAMRLRKLIYAKAGAISQSFVSLIFLAGLFTYLNSWFFYGE